MEKFIVSGYARLVIYVVPQAPVISHFSQTNNLKIKIKNDSMKKLIEKYAEMENVIPEAIQLIFKGNPVTKDDTPNNAFSKFGRSSAKEVSCCALNSELTTLL